MNSERKCRNDLTCSRECTCQFYLFFFFFAIRSTVSFRLGEVLDPYTKLFMVIHGDKGDSEKIYLTPEGGRLEPGRLYTVTVTTTDVGKVSYMYLRI